MNANLRTIQPLTQFELQRQTTALKPHVIRGLVVAALLAVLAMIYLVILATVGSLTGVGGSMLTGVVALDYLLLIATAAPLFATCVTEEREAETLPLLVVSGMSLRGVVLGKGMARFLPALLILIIQIPLIVGSFGFGGFTLRQAIPAIALLLALAVSIAGWSLLMSTLCLRSSHAQLFVVGPLATLEFGGRLCEVLHANYRARGNAVSQWLSDALLWASELKDLSVGEMLLELQLLTGTAPWERLAGMHLAIGLLSGAVAVAVAEPWLQRTFHLMPTRRSRLASLRGTRRLRGDAIFAREFRFAIGGVAGMVLRLLVHLGIAGLTYVVARYLIASASERAIAETVLTVPLVVTAFDLWIHAGRLLSVEVTDRTLPMIVLSSARMPAVILRKLLAACTVLLPAVVAWIALYAIVPGSDRAVSINRTLVTARNDLWITVYVVTQVLVLGHLTMLLSLRQPFKAFALSIAASLIGNVVLAFVATMLASSLGAFGMSRYESQLLLAKALAYMSLLSLVVVHVATVVEAEKVAGE